MQYKIDQKGRTAYFLCRARTCEGASVWVGFRVKGKQISEDKTTTKWRLDDGMYQDKLDRAARTPHRAAPPALFPMKRFCNFASVRNLCTTFHTALDDLRVTWTNTGRKSMHAHRTGPTSEESPCTCWERFARESRNVRFWGVKKETLTQGK